MFITAKRMRALFPVGYANTWRRISIIMTTRRTGPNHIAKISGWRSPGNALTRRAAARADAAAIERGRKVYARPDGKGDGAQAKSLPLPPADLTCIITLWDSGTLPCIGA